MSDAPTLAGARLRLRALLPSDRDERLAIGRDPEFVRLNGGDPHRATAFTDVDADRWYRAFPDALRWAIEHEGRLIGEARLDGINPCVRRARFAIGIFAPAERDRGLGTEATRLVLAHAFDALALTRVDLRVLAFNSRAIRCYEKCGFERYAVARDRAFVDGRWQDDLLMRVTPARFAATVGAGSARS